MSSWFFVPLLLFGVVQIYTKNRILPRSVKTVDEYAASVGQPSKYNGLTDLPSHISRVLVPGHQEFSLVFKNITCRFRILMREMGGEPRYEYRAGAFSSVRSVKDGVKITTRDCAVFSCIGDSIATCGKRFMQYIENSTASFEQLSIEGIIVSPTVNSEIKVYNSSLYPSTLNISLLPLGQENFVYSVKEKDHITIYCLALKKSEVNLFTFALWGRQFERDNKDFIPSFEVEKEKYNGGVNDEYDDDEKEETQEDNDEGIVQNLKYFANSRSKVLYHTLPK